MSEKVVAKAVAVGIACSVAFIAGYIFRAKFDGDNQPITHAILAAESTNQILDSLYGVKMNIEMYDDLSSIASLDKVKTLQEKYRERTLYNIKSFEKRANESSSERRRQLFSQFTNEMSGYKQRLGETP